LWIHLTRMKLLIVIQHRLELWNAPSWFGERLGHDFPGLEIAQRKSYDGVETDLADAEVIFTISLRPKQFTAAPKLKWIHAPTAAVHQFMFPELIESQVVPPIQLKCMDRLWQNTSSPSFLRWQRRSRRLLCCNGKRFGGRSPCGIRGGARDRRSDARTDWGGKHRAASG
jgi:hypothetical protein